MTCFYVLLCLVAMTRASKAILQEKCREVCNLRQAQGRMRTSKICQMH